MAKKYPAVDDKPICGDWFRADTVAKILPIGMIVSIQVINVILTTIFGALTKFEKHPYLSTEMASGTIKTFSA